MIPGEEQLTQIVDEAQQAFWAIITEKIPGIKAEDIPPYAHEAFTTICRNAVNLMLRLNHQGARR